MNNRIKQFLSQFQSWAHWFAGFALSAAAAYSIPSVHLAVNQALSGHLKLLAALGSISSVLLAYANSKKS